MPINLPVVTCFMGVKMKNTLLLCSSGPGLPGVGGVLIRDMLMTDGVGRVSLAALVSSRSGEQIDSSRLNHIQVYPPPNEFCDASPGNFRMSARKLLGRRLNYDATIRSLVTQLRNHIRTEQPEQIWAILNGTVVIDVLYKLLRDLECDLLPQIWDDPHHLAIQRRLDRLSRHRTIRRFHAILKKAKRTAVIGEEMGAAYRKIADGHYIIVRHGAGDETIVPKSEPSCPTEFRIGLSGSMYCPSAWNALHKSLDHLNWRIDGRQAVLVVVGGKIEFVSRSRAECRFLGWRPPEEATQLMRNCDLLYLPQAFEGAERTFAELSFPTKFSTYAATGRPIFVHTPEYGSLTRFCREHQVGMVCNSLDTGEVSRLLRTCENPEILAGLANSSSRIGSSVLTQRNFYAGVQAFLGIGPGVETPMQGLE
jgi:hypothetical protein